MRDRPVTAPGFGAIPPGSHALAFHASIGESAEQAADFLAQAASPETSSFWIAAGRPRAPYEEAILRRCREMLPALHQYAGPSTRFDGGVVGPAPELLEWMQGRSGDLAIGGETSSWPWDAEHERSNLDYESLFVREKAPRVRFLCSYDLRRFTAERAGSVLPRVRRAHTHVVFSRDTRPALRLLQLLAFEVRTDLPLGLRPEFTRAVDEGWLEPALLTQRVELSRSGRAFLAGELPDPD